MYKNQRNLWKFADDGGIGRCLSDFAVYGILKVLPPPNRQREGVRPMKEIISFLISVAASVVAYYICKWLDGEI